MIPTFCPRTTGRDWLAYEFASLAARHGFAAVEFDLPAVRALGLERAAAIYETNQLLPAAFRLPLDWRRDEAAFGASLRELPALARFAQDLDCSRCYCAVLPDVGVPLRDYAATATARLSAAARVLADNGVRLGLEFIGPAHFRPDPRNVWFYDIAGALEVADHINARAATSNVGLLVDSFHWHASGGGTMDLASIPLEQVVHLHLNDAPAGVAAPDLCDDERALPGTTGAIDVTAFLSTLAALGYDGPVGVETFSAALAQLPPDEIAAQASDALSRCLQAAGVKPLRLL